MEIDARNQPAEIVHSKSKQISGVINPLDSFDIFLRQAQFEDIPKDSQTLHGDIRPIGNDNEPKIHPGNSENLDVKIKEDFLEKKTAQQVQSQTQDPLLKIVQPLPKPLLSIFPMVIPFWIVIQDQIVTAVAKRKETAVNDHHIEIRDQDLGSMDMQIQEIDGGLKISFKADSTIFALLNANSEHLVEHLKKKFHYQEIEINVAENVFLGNRDQGEHDSNSQSSPDDHENRAEE